VKRPTMLVKTMLRQFGMDLDLSVERDQKTISDRCKHEGLSFLTITLPKLSDALEQGIEFGLLSCPTDFSCHGRLPRFLGGFFRRVFNKDGSLRQDACAESIYAIRQITRFFKKLRISCSPARENRAIQHYLDVESELRQSTTRVMREDIILDRISEIVWSQVFPEIDQLDLVCRHGPGVTADRYLSNERYSIKHWNTRSEFHFPSDLHCFPNYGEAAGWSAGSDPAESTGPRELDLRDEPGVRVVFVPKTQTAPRVIAIEPSHVQYMQQSLLKYMVPRLESHSLTRRSLKFTDQRPNQNAAYLASKTRDKATLDLKDASDRVHLALVQRIFRSSGILGYLEDSRSLHATLPNGVNLVLTKFASMGSATCFPVEAMVFYTLVLSAMHKLDGVRPSSRSIRRYSRMILVYGDDIIVPVTYTDVVVRYLESYALKVNVSKSFSRSLFRESCGADFYDGVPVKPVYAREVPHDANNRWEPSTVMAWVSTADQFYKNGQWVVACAIHEMVAAVLKRTIPRARETGSGVHFFSYLYTTDLFFDSELQCYKQRRVHYIPLKRKDDIDGNSTACLLKWGLRVGVDNGQSSSGLLPAEFLPEPVPIQEPPLGGLGACTSHDSSDARRVQWGAGFTSSRESRRVYEGANEAASFHRWDVDPFSKMDFRTSVKRGRFKSKVRWVTSLR
jgi:hypothetical protein